MGRSLVCCCLCVSLLAGCGGEEETVSKPAAPPSAPPQPPQPNAGGRKAIAAKPKPKPAPVAEPSGPPMVPLDVKTEPNATVEVYLMRPEPTYDLRTDQPQPDDTPAEGFVSRPPAGDPNAFLMRPPRTDPPTQPAPEGFVTAGPAGPGGLAAAIRHESTGTVLRLVPGGPFVRGSDDGEADERPAHSVSVSPFYLAQTETTVGQYRQFLAANPEGNYEEPLNAGAPDDHPAVGLPYREAAAYCRWAGGRLPTETEWEKAARTGDSLTAVWGAGRPLFATKRRPGTIVAVASEKEDRTRTGLYDLAGNAREWTEDFYDARTYQRDAKTPKQDPTGPRRGSTRVVRGSADSWSLTAREEASMRTRDPLIGFRLAVSAE